MSARFCHSDPNFAQFTGNQSKNLDLKESMLLTVNVLIIEKDQ